jgi:hypothetical protein
MCVQFCLSVAELGRDSEKTGDESDAVSRVGLNEDSSLINDLAEQGDAVDVSTKATGDVAVENSDKNLDENEGESDGSTDLSETENLAFQLEGAKAAALKGLNDRSGKTSEPFELSSIFHQLPCHAIYDLLGVSPPTPSSPQSDSIQDLYLSLGYSFNCLLVLQTLFSLTMLDSVMTITSHCCRSRVSGQCNDPFHQLLRHRRRRQVPSLPALCCAVLCCAVPSLSCPTNCRPALILPST